jgi:putative SOS response-associated peptidase YedK
VWPLCPTFRQAEDRGIIRDTQPSPAGLRPSWNVAPQTFQPVVRLNRDTGERELVLMRWGLVPFWAKDPGIGLRTINAKAETITTAPAFREAIKYRRCLVPADAFYEWQKLDAKTKQPFAIAMKDGKPYALAGLWERYFCSIGAGLGDAPYLDLNIIGCLTLLAYHRKYGPTLLHRG